jgi:ribonuclease HI
VKAELYFDGGARPTNPGHAGFAALVWLHGESEPHVCSRHISWASNNIAEYMGLVVGIKFAKELGATKLAIFSDSKLVVNQVKGEWRVKNDELRSLHGEAVKLLTKLFGDNWTIKCKKRTNNIEADIYCTKALYYGLNINPFTPKRIKDKRPGEIHDPFSRV